jgi:hypothetical protein
MSILSDLAYRQLRIECTEVALQRSAAPSLSIKGPGTIWINDAGQIVFEFKLAPDEYRPYVKAQLENPRPVPTELKDEDYFELTAFSLSGEILRARLLYPEVQNDTPEGFWEGPGTASGKIYELTHCRDSKEEITNTARFFLRKKLPLPVLWDNKGVSPREHFNIDFGSERLDIFDREELTEIRCSLEAGSISKNHHWRMIECLEFAFGKSIYPGLLELQEKERITEALLSSIPEIENEGQMPTPLSIKGRVHRRGIAELLRKFYEHAKSCTDKEYPPLIALALSSIRAASHAQPDAKALTISVAAETLIEACYPEYTQLEKGLESHIDALEQKVRGDKAILASLRDSVAGSIGSFRRPSSSRGLKVFVYTQVRNRAKAKEIFEDWRKLRNTSAHGSRQDPENFYETNRRYNVVLDLCYSMVLARIGYYGPRLLYGEPVGDPWNRQPVRQLPVPRPKISAEQISKIIRSKPWKETAGVWIKEVPMGRDSDYSFELSVTPGPRNGSEHFKIEINPSAVLPDAAACLMTRAEFTALDAAKTACDEIAKRVLLRESEAA